jgi:hypothetical protein
MKLMGAKQLAKGLAAGLAGLAMLASMASAAPYEEPQARPSMAQIPEHPERPVVVELFASQGCGNCPQATQVLASLARRSDVIAITYPVGYWDYLGWDDTFAKQEFANRQKSYNQSLGHRGPYTPQMIFSGKLHSSGVNLDRIAEGFARRDLTVLPARIAVANGEAVVTGNFEGAASVVLVRFKPGNTRVTPGAGANRGRPMDYYNLVTSIEMLGSAASGQTSRFRAACDTGCTILVQQGGPTGPVIGALQKR